MSAKDIQKFLPEYPNVGEQNFSYKLAQKKEFYDLKLTSSEEAEKEKRGELLQSQKIIQRFISSHTPYNKLLLYHQPGTGKTCAASAVVENFASIPVGTMKRRPALILVKGDDLRRSLIREISEVCTKKYIPEPTQKEFLHPKHLWLAISSPITAFQFFFSL